VRVLHRVGRLATPQPAPARRGSDPDLGSPLRRPAGAYPRAGAGGPDGVGAGSGRRLLSPRRRRRPRERAGRADAPCGGRARVAGRMWRVAVLTVVGLWSESPPQRQRCAEPRYRWSAKIDTTLAALTPQPASIPEMLQSWDVPALRARDAGATRSIRSTGAVTRRCGPCGKSIPSTAWSLPEAVSPEPVQAACPLELRQRDLIDVSHERIETLARPSRACGVAARGSHASMVES